MLKVKVTRPNDLDLVFDGVLLATVENAEAKVNLWRTQLDAYVMEETITNRFGPDTTVSLGKNPKEFIATVMGEGGYLRQAAKECIMAGALKDRRLAEAALVYVP